MKPVENGRARKVGSVIAEKGEAGHRERLRERFLANEVGARSDETLLELLLTFSIDRKDVKPLAHELINNFGSLAQVFSASPSELLKVNGIGQSAVTLLKVVNFVQSGDISTEARIPMKKKAGTTQKKLFEDPLDLRTAQRPGIQSKGNVPKKPKGSTPAHERLINEGAVSSRSDVVDIPQEPQRPSLPSKKSASVEEKIPRKFQVSNGYLLEFDQLARVMHFLLQHKEAKRIDRKVLQEDSGLAERQVENLVSMGSAMGIIKPNNQVLTSAGLLIAEHDIFIEKKGTLEWCHYIGAGSYRNLVWFEIFNRLLTESSPMTQEEWSDRLRSDLSGQFTPKTLGKGLREEVRFIVDAYVERNFNKLELLQKSPDERIYRRRYTNFDPLILSAMIYDFCATNDEHLSQVAAMAATPGSPAVVFGLDATLLRRQIEGLHERGWLRYETTHNLDQIRLKPGFSALEFLTAHFEDREPHEISNQSQRGTVK